MRRRAFHSEIVAVCYCIRFPIQKAREFFARAGRRFAAADERSHAQSRAKSRKGVPRGEPCDRQRNCRTHQLPSDAESVNSRRRPFPGLSLRVFATARRCSRPLEWPTRVVTRRPKTSRFTACWRLLTGQTLPRVAPLATPELPLCQFTPLEQAAAAVRIRPRRLCGACATGPVTIARPIRQVLGSS